VLRIVTEAARSADQSVAGALAHSEDGLALSACQGILQEHHGLLSCEYTEIGAVLLQVELPAAEFVPAKSKDATVPVLWQSRPYA
jgi:hypothetical protein